MSSSGVSAALLRRFVDRPGDRSVRLSHKKPHLLRLKSSPSSSSSTVPSSSASHAMRLLQREELAGKRSRLECLLLQQYSKSFHILRSDLKNLVKARIATFVHSSDDLRFTDAEINGLELEIRDLVLRFKREESSSSSSSSSQGNNREGGEVSNASSAGGSKKVSKTPPGQQNNGALSTVKAKERSHSLISQPDWFILNTILSVKEEEEEARKRVEVERKKAALKEQLDQQIMRLRSREKHLREAKVQQREVVSKAQRDFETERAHKEAEKVRQVQQERRANAEQMESLRRQREMDRSERIAEECRQAEQARLLSLQEEKEKQERKESSKRAMDRVISENERNKAIKEERRRQEEALEAKLNREYA